MVGCGPTDSPGKGRKRKGFVLSSGRGIRLSHRLGSSCEDFDGGVAAASGGLLVNSKRVGIEVSLSSAWFLSGASSSSALLLWVGVFGAIFGCPGPWLRIP